MKRVVLTRPVRSNRKDYAAEKENGQGKRDGCIPPLKGGIYTPTLSRGAEKKERGDGDAALARVLALADQLKPAERKKVLAHLALAQGQQEGETRDIDMWAQAIYDGLTHALGGEGRAGVGPLAVKRVLAAPAVWHPVVAFMESSKLHALKVVERQGVYRLLARLTIDKAQFIARQGRAPLSAKLCAQVAVNLGGIFDQAFPGYLANGLAPIVARQMASAQSAAN